MWLTTDVRYWLLPNDWPEWSIFPCKTRLYAWFFLVPIQNRLCLAPLPNNFFITWVRRLEEKRIGYIKVVNKQCFFRKNLLAALCKIIASTSNFLEVFKSIYKIFSRLWYTKVDNRLKVVWIITKKTSFGDTKRLNFIFKMYVLCFKSTIRVWQSKNVFHAWKSIIYYA